MGSGPSGYRELLYQSLWSLPIHLVGLAFFAFPYDCTDVFRHKGPVYSAFQFLLGPFPIPKCIDVTLLWIFCTSVDHLKLGLSSLNVVSGMHSSSS